MRGKHNVNFNNMLKIDKAMKQNKNEIKTLQLDDVP